MTRYTASDLERDADDARDRAIDRQMDAEMRERLRTLAEVLNGLGRARRSFRLYRLRSPTEECGVIYARNREEFGFKQCIELTWAILLAACHSAGYTPKEAMRLIGTFSSRARIRKVKA